ncbi:MAG: sulfatase [Planctomycetales bacterium]|nr:sulfatase [Planctomycetales bacterium]
MNRPSRLLCIACLLLCCQSGWSQQRPPNVVLFLVDDMGWMDSTPYGSQYYETPSMERLAAQAMRFTNAYAVPLCSPTRATILTGQHSARHRVTSASGHQPAAAAGTSPYPDKAPANRRLLYANSQNYLDPELITLAEVLKSAGYRTGHFGKWHLGLSPEHWPNRQGFETTWHCAPDPGPPSYFSPYGVSKDGTPGGRHRVGNITDGPEGEYITDRLTDEAIKFIEQHRDEPFYLNLWQYGVHGPWGHKPSYTEQFAKREDPRGKQRNPIMASMLKSVDDSLGRVLDKLDELKLTENTLFIFFSDNGGNTHSNVPGEPKTERAAVARSVMMQDWRKWAGPEPPTNNAPLREGKGRIYEGGQRVPLMIRWPGRVKPASTSDAIVGAIDLFPTVLDALRLKPPEHQVVDGLSLVPVLTQSAPWTRNVYFTWFPHLVPAASVREGDWKLIRKFEPHASYPETRELYNLRTDIGETANLATKMPEKVAHLDGLLDEFIRETGALAPRPNPDYKPSANAADPLRSGADGLVPRFCQLDLTAGAMRVTGENGRQPFLGTARVKHNGQVVAKLRLRGGEGGAGKLLWKTAGQESFPDNGQSVDFRLPADGAWHDVTVNLPVSGRLGTVRIYLPAASKPVDIQSIRFEAADTGRLLQSWDFAKLAPSGPAQKK